MEAGRVCNTLFSKRVPLAVSPRTQTSRLSVLNYTTRSSPLTSLSHSNARNISTSSPSSSPAQAAALASNQQQQPSDNDEHGPAHQSSNLPGPRNPKIFAREDLSSMLSKIGFDETDPSKGTFPPARPSTSSRGAAPIDEMRNIYQFTQLNEISRSVKAAVTQNREGAEKWFSSLRVSPTLGKSIAVDPARNRDAGSAISMLEARLARNKLKLTVKENRFHVRRGQRRKNIRSVRWKRLFSAAFRSTVQRCEKLRAQGW